MDFFENGQVIREWLLAQPWLGFAHDWVAGAPAWQILGALTAPILILLLGFVLLLMRLGSKASKRSSETVEDLPASDPKTEQTHDAVGAQSPTSIASSDSSVSAAEMVTKSHPSTPAPEVQPTASSTEQSSVSPEPAVEPGPSTPESKTD